MQEMLVTAQLTRENANVRSFVVLLAVRVDIMYIYIYTYMLISIVLHISHVIEVHIGNFFAIPI